MKPAEPSLPPVPPPPVPEKKPEPVKPPLPPTAITPETKPEPPVPATPSPEGPSIEFKGGVATGLVIDGRGLGLRPALLPRIVDPEGRVLRDPTRGGLATALCEIAVSSRVGIRLEEGEIPVREEVRGACELLGFDPLYVACEGRFLAIVPGERAEAALSAIRSRTGGEGARRIGTVVGEDPGRLVLHTRLGSHRLLERLSGEQLPRIC